jgi:signal transduction histidine kinase
MKKRWNWNERTRLLLMMELAVVLPAAALIFFSFLHLKSIQRDRVVDAAIQRDFYQVLAISERQMNAKAYEMVEQVRQGFPQPGHACEQSMAALLQQYPYAAHLFMYDPENGLVFRSQSGRMHQRDFRAESEELAKELPEWLPIEYESTTKMFLEMQAKGKPPRHFFPNLAPRGDKKGYESAVMFLVPASDPQGHPAFGGMIFDAEFLRDQFFPAQLNELMSHNLTENPSEKNHTNHAVMMLRMKYESSPLAASAEWDGGAPEIERSMEGAFPGLTMAIKLQGTTIAALGQKFMRTNFLILGGISLLLAAGILLTYHNVNKEMALARLKSDFVSNVSHELRTPLSLIRLYAETLEMGRLSAEEKYHEYYRIIRKESERLSALINNILDFSRIEAGKKEYDFRDTDVAELVRNTLESYRYQIEQNGFKFEEHIADDLPSVRLDREAIARSLLNLVNNALKYSQQDKYLGVTLSAQNGSVKLEVIDHGIGIPRQEQHKIFEKFYRVGDPLVHNTKGSGLGLSLVRHIVHAHGGEVSVESVPGQGSKFVIALPVEPVPSIKAASA